MRTFNVTTGVFDTDGETFAPNGVSTFQVPDAMVNPALSEVLIGYYVAWYYAQQLWAAGLAIPPDGTLIQAFKLQDTVTGTVTYWALDLTGASPALTSLTPA